MVGLSSMSSAAPSDKIPLNKSFDSQETSDTYKSRYGAAWSSKSTVTVWGLREINLKSNTQTFEQKERRTSICSAETLQVRNIGRRGSTNNSPSLDVTFESVDSEENITDESEPRAIIVSRFPLLSTSEMSNRAQDSEFFDNMKEMRDGGGNMISLRSDSNQGCSDPLRMCGEEVETVSFNGSWQEGSSPKQDPYRPPDSIEATRTQACAAQERVSREEDTNWGEIVRTAWGCKDQKTRRGVLCIILLFVTAMAVTVFILGFFLENKTKETVAVVQSTTDSDDGYDWVGDRPENTPPVGRPLAAPAFWGAAPNPPRPTTSPVSRAEMPIHNPTPSPGATTTNQTRNATARQVETTTPTRSPVAALTAMPASTTSTPTRLPVEETIKPTDEPSTCESIIVVDNFCYVEDEDIILVDFVNCDPQDDDWVGIWLASEDPDNLSEDCYTWAWSCGSQSCLSAPTTNRIAFNTSRLGFETFRAFLVIETPQNHSYLSHAMSEPFIVERNCSR